MTSRPWTERINLRVLVFVGLLLFVFGSIGYKALDTTLSGGIKDRGDFMEVDLKAISDFEMDPTLAKETSIPKPFRELDGKRVQLIGEMWLDGNARQQNQFDLVYSIEKCCLSGPPKIQHFIKSTPAPGAKIQRYSGLVKAVGTLRVGIRRNDAGDIESIYRYEVESLEPYNG